MYSCLESMFDEDEERGLGTQRSVEYTAARKTPHEETRPPEDDRGSGREKEGVEGEANGDGKDGGGSSGQKEVYAGCGRGEGGNAAQVAWGVRLLGVFVVVVFICFCCLVTRVIR